MIRDEEFEQLFDGCFARCERLAQRIVHDPSLAEELAAEAFARAWSRWSRLRHEKPEGWLLRVTANLAVDTTRRQRPAVDPVAPPRGPADIATLHVALMAALQKLSRRQREAIVLRYLAGLSESEVSASLGVSAGSVKTHIHRGMAHLRSSLGTNDDLEVSLALEP
ncbi:MAG: sigma-70 family RNA polymerase sigma factor [Acidimicrobiales bacterium]